MGRFRRSIIIFGAAVTVILALAVPPIDIPETAFDETDTPVNQTTPVVLHTNCVTQVPLSVLISWLLSFDDQARTPNVVTVIETSRSDAPCSLLHLLCTLLC